MRLTKTSAAIAVLFALGLNAEARWELEPDPLMEAMAAAVGAPSPAAQYAARFAGASGANPGSCETRQQDALPYNVDANYFHDVDELTDVTTPGNVPADRAAFCARPEEDLVAGIRDDSRINDKMSFENPPGDFGTGLCWLHSRFQRNASYLADYQPKSPRPTDAEARQIIERIAEGKVVTRIAGFENLYDFSKAYKGLITRQLNKMGVDCVANTKCWNRMGDSATTTAGEMQARMDGMYQRFLEHREVQFARIRCSSFGPFTSHSLLIGDIQPKRLVPTRENPLAATTITGYTFTVLDPNSPVFGKRIEYNYGDTSLPYTWDNKPVQMMMYPEYDEDLPKLRAAANSYCGRR